MASAKQGEDRLDNTVSVIITAVVAALLIAYIAIPIISNAIVGLDSQYRDLFTAAIVIMIFSIVILVVRGFNSAGRAR